MSVFKTLVQCFDLSNGHKEKNGSQSRVVKSEVKNKGGKRVGFFLTFHSGLLKEGIFMV